MRSIEGVTQGIVKQLEEIAQRRLQSSSPDLSSQTSKVQSVMPIAAPPVSRPEVPSAQVKAVSPPKSKPLTIERLIQDRSKQQDTPAVLGGGSQPAPPDTDVQHQPSTPSVREPDPSRLRSRERTPARQPRAATPQREAQPTLPAIEDGPPLKRELMQEPPRERERTPPKERSHGRRRRSPSRDRSSEKRQRSPTPTKDRSHRRKKRSPSPIRDRTPDERQRSPTPPKERSHYRRRRSPTPSHDRLSEEKGPSPSPSREPSRERRRRRRSPEPSEMSSKKSKKSRKKEKKDSKHSRRTERVEPVQDRTTREERSRSTRRPESPPVQRPQAKKEEFLLWVIGNLCMHGQDSSTLVNVIKTGVSNHHLLKSVGMIHNRVISNTILNNLLRLSIGLRSNSNKHSNNSCHHYRHLFFHRERNQVYNHLQA